MQLTLVQAFIPVFADRHLSWRHDDL